LKGKLEALISRRKGIPVQRTVSQLNASVTTTYDPNSRFTEWNIVAVVIGGLCLILAIIGTFIPE